MRFARRATLDGRAEPAWRTPGSLKEWSEFNHEVIGKLVALCLDRGAGFAQLSLEDYRAAHPVFAEDVYSLLDVRRSLESRRTVGAPSFSNVAAQLKAWQEKLHAE